MLRYYALAFMMLGCGCGSVSTPPSNNGPDLAIVALPQTQDETARDDRAGRSTVPMTADDQKDASFEAVARALHIYWFFGSR
jgi:hypothetical protein